MAYPDLDLGTHGPNMPLDTSNLEALYKGMNKTNGFLMRNVDGRIPALQQPIGRMSIGADNVLSDEGVIPYGNAFWRDLATFASNSGVANAQKPERAAFCGVLKFNQGWQAGHPVRPWGVPSYSKGTIVSRGLVGYKVAMAGVGQEEEYLSYLKGVASADDNAVRTVYNDWVALLAAAADGAKLGIFFANDSGFPIVAVVPKANQAAPTLTGATFGGFADVYERENEAVFFNIEL